MATEDEGGIEFSLIPGESQQHFRLLELPTELLKVITSENAPILQMKSLEGPSGNSLDSNAVLCTEDKTYSLRQVSTSNAVYLTQPTSIPDDTQAPIGLEAIAQSTSTLELQQTKRASAIPYIKAALPVYTSTGHYDPERAISKEQLFTNIPLSDVECEQGWIELACFETQDSRHSLLPSDDIKLKAWQSILQVATATGVDLTQSLGHKEQTAVVSSNIDCPVELFKAVLRSMASETTDPEVLQLDETKCARVVGLMVLREQTQNALRSIPTKAFTSAWADLLPEQWRAHVNTTLVESHSKLENGGQDITYSESGGHPVAKSTVPEETKSTLGAKRKWHEKFRASKKAG